MFAVNRNPSRRDLRWFALGMLVGFPMISLLLVYLSRVRSAEGPPPRVSLGLAIGLSAVGIVAGLVALTSPRLGRRLYVAWMTLTLPIGMFMSTLLLTVLYFVFLPVFSLIVRRHDPLRKKLGGPTYWEDHKLHEPTIDRMRRPF